MLKNWNLKLPMFLYLSSQLHLNKNANHKIISLYKLPFPPSILHPSKLHVVTFITILLLELEQFKEAPPSTLINLEFVIVNELLPTENKAFPFKDIYA
jgi:hypothetical protein